MLDRLSNHAGDTCLQSFSVTYEYPVVFTRNAFAPDNLHLITVIGRREPAKRQRCAVFIDTGVLSASPDLADRIVDYANIHAARMQLAGPIVTVPGSERCKNDPLIVSRLLAAMSERAIDRHSFVIAIGGGAVLDVVGYASAIFHRGVRHIRLPTTVLAQGDSGVGVKNAINALGVKNLVGTFAPPWAIINDSAFIDTLPERERRAGMAEAVKVALIRDREFFHWLEDCAPELAKYSILHLERLIKVSAALHMRQITSGGDPFETGSARPLDFGHWAAHKLERLTSHAVNHGEAVAIGIALDTGYSVAAGLLTKGKDERVLRLLKRLGFHLWNDALKQRDGSGELAILQGLTDFQQHLGGDLTVTLLEGIGKGVEVHAMDRGIVSQCIDWLKERA